MSKQLCVWCSECFQNPYCTNFWEVKSVMDDSISRTMTNLQLVCHFVDSQPSVVKDQCVNLFIVSFSLAFIKGSSF
jgi:hypothetical protein